jgi:hypothetical protein
MGEKQLAENLLLELNKTHITISRKQNDGKYGNCETYLILHSKDSIYTLVQYVARLKQYFIFTGHKTNKLCFTLHAQARVPKILNVKPAIQP